VENYRIRATFGEINRPDKRFVLFALEKWRAGRLLVVMEAHRAKLFHVEQFGMVFQMILRRESLFGIPTRRPEAWLECKIVPRGTI
jgi:hypothetical protein